MSNFFFKPASDYEYCISNETEPYWVTHTNSWVRVIEQSFSHIKGYILSDNSKITDNTSFLPVYRIKLPLNRVNWVSIPYSTVSDPILKDQSLAAPLYRALLDNTSATKCKIEIRTMAHSNLTEMERFQGYRGYISHQLYLDGDEDEIFRRFHKKSVQVLIKKSQCTGTVLKEGISLSDVAIFYDLYVRTRKELGLPPQPFRFFRNMWNELHPKNYMDLLMAENNGKIVAAVWALKNNWFYSFEYIGRAEHRDDTNSAHFLYWNGIKKALAAKAKVVSFARTSMKNNGLNRFKLNWGTVPVPYVDFTYPFDSIKSREDQHLYKLVKKIGPALPLPFFRMLGEVIYRFI